MVSLMKRRSASLAKECPHGVLDIALKCHLGHTRSLEILPIKIGGPSIPKCPQGGAWHLGKKRGVLNRGGGPCQNRIDLVELRLRGVVAHEPGGALHLTDHWIKGAVGVLRGAEIA